MADDNDVARALVGAQGQPKPGEWRVPTWDSMKAGAGWLLGNSVKQVMPTNTDDLAKAYKLFQLINAGGLSPASNYLSLLVDQQKRPGMPDTDPSAY